MELSRPDSDDELYLGRFGDVDPCRPVFQGDVYRDVLIPGYPSEDHSAVAILQHPCTMRRGVALRPRVAVVPVRPHDYVPPARWPSHFTRAVPMPSLSVVSGQPHAAAVLDEPGTVEAHELTNERLVAQLSVKGVLLFQQRQIYAASHAVIGLDTLEEFSAPAIAEAELLAEWRAELVPRHGSGVSLEDALRAEAEAFEHFIRQDSDVQQRLENVDTRADARRHVYAEIERRCLAQEPSTESNEEQAAAEAEPHLPSGE